LVGLKDNIFRPRKCCRGHLSNSNLYFWVSVFLIRICIDYNVDKVCNARDTPLADETAALDIGANNLVACTTTTGEQYLSEGRELFQRFRETTQKIARLQSKLEDGQYSSDRIRRLSRKRTRRRDNAQEALSRDLLDRLYPEGVDTVYVGGLTNVLDTHWSVETNGKIYISGRSRSLPND